MPIPETTAAVINQIMTDLPALVTKLRLEHYAQCIDVIWKVLLQNKCDMEVRDLAEASIMGLYSHLRNNKWAGVFNEISAEKMGKLFHHLELLFKYCLLSG